MNVQRPAPAGSHGEIRKRVIATMVGALAQVAPDKVAGDLCRTSFHNLLGGFDQKAGKEWVHYEWSSGGNGAFAEDDGPSAMAPIDWGDLVTVQSTEVIESRMPLLVENSRLAIDSGGAGTTRGGLSMNRKITILAPQATYSLLSDGAIVPAFGVLGGRSGLPVGAWIERNGAIEEFDSPGKVAGSVIEQGASVIMRSAGGGGYGDPLGRDPERVRIDRQEGLVSQQSVDEVYGVVFTSDGRVDESATMIRREQLRRSIVKLQTVSGASCYEDGAVSHRRVCRLNPADAQMAKVAHDDLIELDSRRCAPLRAWVRIDDSVISGTTPVDMHGLSMLKLSCGDPVEFRKIQAHGRPNSHGQSMQSPAMCMKP